MSIYINLVVLLIHRIGFQYSSFCLFIRITIWPNLIWLDYLLFVRVHVTTGLPGQRLQVTVISMSPGQGVCFYFVTDQAKICMYVCINCKYVCINLALCIVAGCLYLSLDQVH